MEKRLPKLMGATVLTLLMLSFLVATPASAVSIAPPFALAAEPVWATINAAAQGNYPGGNELFDVFVVDSALPPEGNVTVQTATLTAPALPVNQQSNFATGLPTILSPGQSILLTIYLPIPADFAHSNFTANLVVNVLLQNGTASIPLKLTGSTTVFMLGLPGSGGQTSTSSAQTTSSTSSAQSTQSGTVSSTLFAAGVAIPSIIAIILLVLLVRRGSKP